MSDTAYIWIFAVVFVIHLGEELWGGLRSLDPQNLRGLDLSRRGFIFANLFALVLFAGASVSAVELGFPQFLLIGLATFMLVNGASHLITSIRDTAYSPGVVTGTLFFMPLAVLTLIRLQPKMAAPRFAAAIFAGLGMQLTASLVAHRSRQVMRAIRARTRGDGARELMRVKSESMAINENLKG